MIGSLRGTLRVREAGRLLVDVAGVGYVVHVPMSTFFESPDVGQEVALLVHTQVREDAITLYGFQVAAELEVFERLLGVSGVGPRTALAALSALGPDVLVTAIREGDARRLSSVPGIGKRTAERIIIDLQDRLEATRGGRAAGAGRRGPADAATDVTSALVNLGYPEKQASRAVADALATTAPGGKPAFDDLLRQSLQQLGRGA